MNWHAMCFIELRMPVLLNNRTDIHKMKMHNFSNLNKGFTNENFIR